MTRRSFALGLTSLVAGAMVAPNRAFAQQSQDKGTQADKATSDAVIKTVKTFIGRVNRQDKRALQMMGPEFKKFFLFGNDANFSFLKKADVYSADNVRVYQDDTLSVDLALAGFGSEHAYNNYRWYLDSNAEVILRSEGIALSVPKGHTSTKVVLNKSDGDLVVTKPDSAKVDDSDVLIVTVDNTGTTQSTLMVAPLPKGLSFEAALQGGRPEGITDVMQWGWGWLTAIDPGANQTATFSFVDPGNYVVLGGDWVQSGDFVVNGYGATFTVTPAKEATPTPAA